MLDILQSVGIAVAAITGLFTAYIAWQQSRREATDREPTVGVRWKHYSSLGEDWHVLHAFLDARYPTGFKYRPTTLKLKSPEKCFLLNRDDAYTPDNAGGLELLDRHSLLSKASRCIDIERASEVDSSESFYFILLIFRPNSSSRPLMRLSWSHLSSRSRKTTKVRSRKLPENITSTTV